MVERRKTYSVEPVRRARSARRRPPAGDARIGLRQEAARSVGAWTPMGSPARSTTAALTAAAARADDGGKGRKRRGGGCGLWRESRVRKRGRDGPVRSCAVSPIAIAPRTFSPSPALAIGMEIGASYHRSQAPKPTCPSQPRTGYTCTHCQS